MGRVHHGDRPYSHKPVKSQNQKARFNIPLIDHDEFIAFDDLTVVERA